MKDMIAKLPENILKTNSFKDGEKYTFKGTIKNGEFLVNLVSDTKPKKKSSSAKKKALEYIMEWSEGEEIKIPMEKREEDARLDYLMEKYLRLG